MYHGSNVTALQSQKWLGESLMQLMQEQPYERITVGGICRQADLSRQTFYNIFESKDEVLRFCMRIRYEEKFCSLEQKQTISATDLVEFFYSIINENHTFFRLMIDNQLDSIFADEISKCIFLFAGRFVRPERKNEMLPYSAALLSGALGHLLVYWFRQEEPVSIEKLTGLVTEFFEGRLFELDLA